MEYQEVTCDDGTIIRVRPFPQPMITEIFVRHPELADPPDPIEVIHGAAGDEYVPARKGTKEYAEWQQKQQTVSLLRTKAVYEAKWSYGIVAWKRPGDKQFTSKPPKGWTAPDYIVGIEPRQGAAGRRLDYILHELIDESSRSAIESIINSGSALTVEEVSTAEDTFQD